MNIVILDGNTCNPGDLSWDALKKLADTTVYERSTKEETLQRAKDADIILINKTGIDAEIINALPKLKYIGVLATGYNVIDLNAASKKNIVVTNIPAYSTHSVAQMVFAHILNFTQRVFQHNESVKDGDWVNSIDFCYWKYPLTELTNKKLGIIGGGTIGTSVAHLGKAFGMEVFIYTPRFKEHLNQDFQLTTLENVIAQSDFLSLHCPLNEKTKHLINGESLNRMKKEAILINTGRGLLVDEYALADALNKGIIAGAGLDVLSTEPPEATNPLLKAKNCYITPHNAWATFEARKRLIEIASNNVKSFLDGNPQNVINPEVLKNNTP